MGRTLASKIWRGCQQPILVILAGGMLMLWVAFPLGALTTQLMESGAADTIADTLSSRRLWVLFGSTLLQSLAVTAVALFIGIPMGVLLSKNDVFGSKALLGLHAFPLFLPPLLLALGWSHIFGRLGWLGSGETSSLLFGRIGAVLVLGLTFSPIVTALTYIGLLRIDASVEDAALSVASPTKVVLGVLLPLARPFVALAAFIVFILSLSEIAVPLFLRVRTYSAAVFARIGGFSFRPAEAFALALPLLALAAALLFIERRWIRFEQAGMFSAQPRRKYSLGRMRVLWSLAAWAYVAFGAAPLLALGLHALGATDVWVWVADPLKNSLVVSVLSATLITSVGIVLGHRVLRGMVGGGSLDAVAMFGFVTPAAVLGAGIVAAWNRPELQWAYTSIVILVLGLSARYAVIGVRMIAAVMGRHSPNLEDAARVSGAGYLRRLFLLMTPLNRHAILAVWLVVLLFCLRDLETLTGFYPPGRETLPIRIFTLEANGSPSLVAALAMIHVCLTAGVMLAAWLVSASWSRAWSQR